MTESPYQLVLQIGGACALLAVSHWFGRAIRGTSNSLARKIFGMLLFVCFVAFIGGETIGSESQLDCERFPPQSNNAIDQVSPSVECRSYNRKVANNWIVALAILSSAAVFAGFRSRKT
jgi:hypothetical protein